MWSYFTAQLNTNGRDCVADGQRTTLNALGSEGWEVVAVWALPGGMLRALLKRRAG